MAKISKKKLLSTLVYVESRSVDNGGKLDLRHLNDEDYTNLDTLEESAWIVNEGTGINRWYRLTDEGWKQAGLERRRRAEKNRR